jgi:hypothetical protein
MTTGIILTVVNKSPDVVSISEIIGKKLGNRGRDGEWLQTHNALRFIIKTPLTIHPSEVYQMTLDLSWSADIFNDKRIRLHTCVVPFQLSLVVYEYILNKDGKTLLLIRNNSTENVELQKDTPICDMYFDIPQSLHFILKE